ncbi:MAG: TRAP transporter small permease subunit [Chloroflexota bacterium]
MLSKIGKWYSEVFLYKVSLWISLLAQAAMLVSLMVTTINVIGRKLLPLLGIGLGPLLFSWELTQLSMVFMSVCAFSYAWYTSGHVRVEMVRDALKNERQRALLDAGSALVGMLVLAIYVWGAYFIVKQNYARHMYLPITLIPITPFAVIYLLVLAHAVLVIMRSFIGLTSKAMGKKFAGEPYLEGQ